MCQYLFFEYPKDQNCLDEGFHGFPLSSKGSMALGRGAFILVFMLGLPFSFLPIVLDWFWFQLDVEFVAIK